jgi:hypothetical protein
MVMDQNDTLPLSMPELLEKFAGHAEPLLGQLGLKKGIYTSYIYIYIYIQIRHLHTSLLFSTTLSVFLAKCWIPKS